MLRDESEKETGTAANCDMSEGLACYEVLIETASTWLATDARIGPSRAHSNLTMTAFSSWNYCDI